MWREKTTRYDHHLVENEGGKTLGYCPGTGVTLLEQDGFAFKDLARAGRLLPYEDWRLPAEARAEDLANRLTIEQIAGLMCYSVHQLKVGKELQEDQIQFLRENVRSVLNSCGLSGASTNADQIGWSNSMQRFAESQPMGIPCYIASDPRNGQGVSDWPGNLSLAATFDPAVAGEAARCQSVELRDLGVTCFLAPQVDVASDPRWFRFSGTFGEDPALARDMARAFCDGLQSTYDEKGNDLGWGKDSVTAMVKHWTGEAACEGGREAHLQGGKYAVYPNGNFEALLIPFVDGAFRLEGKTGAAAAVMSSYSAAYAEDGSLGDPVGSSFSDYKIRRLLRERYGFTGAVCTDWMVLNEGKAEGKRSCGWGKGIEELDADPGENAFKAILAGVDQMGGCSNPSLLLRAYAIGCEKVGKEAMDAAFAASAKRLLQGYFLTGLFENPYLDEDACLADINSADKQAAAFAAQVKAIVMLKNQNGAIRPASKRLRVYVPATFLAAHDTFNHHHGLSRVEAKVAYPIRLPVLERYFDLVTDRVEGARITRAAREEIAGCDLVLIPARAPELTFAQGTRPDGEYRPLSLQYRPYTADGDAVRRVSLAGDRLEDGSRENRSYFGRTETACNQEQLDQILEAAAKAREAGIPSVLCLFADKPLCFHEFEAAVDSILVTFSSPSLYGGSDTSAEALCRIVAGLEEPSGLLPMQMPRDMEAVERQSEDTPRDMDCYTDAAGHRYDFAFGMNYAGVIRDERVARYRVPVLTRPAWNGRP